MAGIFQTPELALGIAVGGAAGAAFEPKLEVPKQSAWAANPVRLPDVGLIAELVAGGKVSLADGRSMAARLGFAQGPFDSLTWLAQNRLDFPAMLRLWRLFPSYVSPSGKSIGALVTETLAHERLDWDYFPLLEQMQYAEKPGIGDIAYSVVRGYLPTNIPLPVAPPATSTKVKRFPQSSKLAETWAEEIGYNSEALELMIARSGLSLAPIFAANAYFRELIADDDYHLAIAEGDLRTEWADVLRDAAREIPTADAYAEYQLRGGTDAAGRRAGAARHGMTADDSDVLYYNKGRAPAPHAVTTGLARGGVYPSTYADVPEPYRTSIERANTIESMAGLEYANRYTYPSGFQIRSETQNGTLLRADSEQILLEIGWSPHWAAFFSTAWAGGGTSGADKNVTKAQNALYTATHKSYIADEISDATATTSLQAAGVAAAAVPAVLQVWQAERDLIRKSLSAAQIKKAWSEGVTNPATGAPWTEAEATTRLLELGYGAEDAATFLSL